MLLAMGIEPQTAQTSVRMTFGSEMTASAVDTVVAELVAIFDG